jgi:hypothetical protein
MRIDAFKLLFKVGEEGSEIHGSTLGRFLALN